MLYALGKVYGYINCVILERVMYFQYTLFPPIVFESKILPYPMVQFDNLCNRFQRYELNSLEMFRLKVVMCKILNLVHTQSRGASTWHKIVGADSKFHL